MLSVIVVLCFLALVVLTSPNIGGVGNCYLRFFWNMYGSDVGTLAVHVNTKDPLLSIYPKWSESGECKYSDHSHKMNNDRISIVSISQFMVFVKTGVMLENQVEFS